MASTSVLGKAILGSAILASGDSGSSAPTITRAVSNTLSLGHSVGLNREINLSLSSGLTLGQSNAPSSTLTATPANSLILSQIVDQNIKSFDIVSTIEFQQAIVDNSKYGIASNNLSFGQLAAAGFGTSIISATSNLILDQTVATNIKQYSVANALVLAQSVYAPSNVAFTLQNNLVLDHSVQINWKDANAISVLTFGQIATYQLPISQALTSGLVLGQAVSTNIKDISVTSALVLNQVVLGQAPYQRFTGNTITFGQSVAVRQAVINISVNSFLSFSQRATRTQEVDASNSLTLGQSVIRTFDEDIASALQLQSIADSDVTKPTYHSLLFSQTVAATLERARTLTSELAIGQAVFPVILKPGITCQYSPIVTSDSEMPSTAPDLMRQSYVTLTYPYVSPTFTVNLRSPKYGNSNKLSASWIRNRSRSGDLIGFFDPVWPKTEILALSFEGLSQAQATDLLAMFHESLGQEIGYLDYEGRQWKGIITTPINEIIQSGPNCRYDASFEFQGEVV